MKTKNFVEAMNIIADHHSTEIEINPVKENEQVDLSNRIVITGCCASVITKLIDAGFSLSIDEGKLSIDDYAKK